MTNLPPTPPLNPSSGSAPGGNRGMGTAEELAAMWTPAPPAKASPAGRLLALGSILLAAFAPLAIHGEVGWGLLLAASVGAGVGLSFAAESASERVFKNMPGPVAAILTVIVCFFVAAAMAAVGIDPPPHLMIIPPLVVLGFDWLRVGRIRAVLALGGLPVVVAIGQESSGHLVGLAWLVTTVVAFWMLTHDEVEATPRPAPLGPQSPASGVRSIDLVQVIGLSLLAGLTLAFLFSRPSCSFSPPLPDLEPSAPPPSEFRLDDGGGEGGAGAPGEFEMEIDGEGKRYVRDTRTGQRYQVDNTPGGAVVRDRNGEVVAEIDGEGVVAHGGEGETTRYQRDVDGDLYLEGADGERYRVDRDGDETVLRDGDGNVVATREDDGELVIHDPDGDVLVHDPDGNGTIPLPRDAVLDAIPGTSRDTTYSYDDGKVVATDGDGTTRTYDQDDDGRERVRVAEPGEEPRTFTSEETDDELIIYETDDDDNVVRTWRYAPDAQVDDSWFEEEPTEPEVEEPEPSDDDGGLLDGILPWIVGALVVAVLGATWWHLRRKPDDAAPVGPTRDWARDLSHRLEAVGRERGRLRQPDETLMAYCTVLADEVVFERRLHDAARTIDAGLFARTEPSLSDRQEAEVVVAALEAYDPERPVGTPV